MIAQAHCTQEALASLSGKAGERCQQTQELQQVNMVVFDHPGPQMASKATSVAIISGAVNHTNTYTHTHTAGHTGCTNH